MALTATDLFNDATTREIGGVGPDQVNLIVSDLIGVQQMLSAAVPQVNNLSRCCLATRSAAVHEPHRPNELVKVLHQFSTGPREYVGGIHHVLFQSLRQPGRATASCPLR